MNDRLVCISLAAALLLGLVACTTVVAAPSARTLEVGDAGSAEFSYTDSTGNIVTNVSVRVVDSKITDTVLGDSGAHELDVTVAVRDDSIGAYTAYLVGQTDNFQFDRKSNLSAAHVVATIPMYDLFRFSYIDYSVDLGWSALGSPTRTKQEYVQHAPGDHGYTTILTKIMTVYQPSTCFGTVSDGSTNYTPVAAVGDYTSLEHFVSDNTLTGPR